MSCLIVGVLNCTPYLFSDGGVHGSVEAAVAAGVRMAESGANWVDVGGEVDAAGAVVVSEEEELARVIPVIRGLRKALAPSVADFDRHLQGGDGAGGGGGGSVGDQRRVGRPAGSRILKVGRETGAGIVLGHCGARRRR